MRRRFVGIFVCILMTSTGMIPPAAADELGDAIRQAEEAKNESQRLARSAEEGRVKARQLYEETKSVKFQLSAENYFSASSRFGRAADAFQRARYYLDRLRSTGNAALIDEVQDNMREASDHYNQAIQQVRLAEERFNGGIEEYNRQLRDERKRQAAQSKTDAFNLMKTIEDKIKKAEGKPGSTVMVACLKTSYARAQWAFGQFHSAAENPDRIDYYREKSKYGVLYYNQAIEILKQLSETGKCKSP